MDTAKKGRAGEDRAAGFIENSGFRILKRNYRKAGGEIDIIAEKGDLIVFFEIKNWNGYDEMELERIVNAGKRNRIIRTARSFLAERRNEETRHVRFDVILMEGDANRIHHFKNAFTESGVV